MRWLVTAMLAGCGFEGMAAPIGEVSAPDAPALRCPDSYRGGYRVLTTAGTAIAHGDACAADAPGATHLAVVNDAAELATLAAAIAALELPHNSVWLGGVQASDAQTPDSGWLALDGAPLISAWGGAEPNDSDRDEDDHREQFARLERGRGYLGDSRVTDGNGAVCECDGQPIAERVRVVIDGYRASAR